MPIKVFQTVFIVLLFTAMAALPAFAQDSLLHKLVLVGRLHVVYVQGNETHTIDTALSHAFENADIVLSESVKPVNDAKSLLIAFTSKKDITLQIFEVVLHEDLQDVKAVFCNGFQSWTTSREYGLDEKITRIGAIGKAFASHMGDYDYFKYSGKKGMLHGWACTYLRKQNGQIVFTGSINEYSGYTSFLHDTKQHTLTVAKDCKGLEVKANSGFNGIRLIMMTGDDDTVFNQYSSRFYKALATVANSKGLDLQESKAQAKVGWTSWYNYYNRISEDTMLANLRNFSSLKVPIDMFQIDDGYQLSTGDWLHTNKNFQRGMKPIADSIHKAGYHAGIWLAPFICARNSSIYEQHADWLLKNDKGKAIVVGYNPLWNGNFYALDIYNKDVKAYLKTVFDTVLRAWNYDMVKLDFLYAGALNPPKDKTRGQVMTDGMLLLRELVGNDKFIDGCGVPIGPAFKLTDYCRVSSDVHRKWEQKLLKALEIRERLSVWNSLTTVIGRQQLAGRMFLNDPDAYILRTENQHLSKEQKHTMLLVDNVLGKLVLMSDNIARYDPTQMAQYLSAFPYTEKEHIKVVATGDLYRINFETEGRSYLALVNLSGKIKEMVLDTNTYFNGIENKVLAKGSTVSLKPYQSMCLFQISNMPFEVLGGGNHLLPGMEVENIDLKSDHSMNLKYRAGANHSAGITIKVPTEFTEMQVNGKSVKAVDTNGIHCLFYRP